MDYAAATPMNKRVVAAMKPYFSEQFYNPSATYLDGRAAKRSLEEAHGVIASWLGSRPSEITFTAGGTEANNLAIQGVMRAYPDGELLVSAVEHDSVLAPAKLFKHKQIPVDARGIVDLKKLESMITPSTVMVSVMQVNNELGSVQPIREISNILGKIKSDRKRRANATPLYLHTDAAQAANFFDLHISRLGVDLLSLNGGKIYGPKQTGALYVKAGIVLQPLILGGGQEQSLRSGTQNVAGAVGLAKALDIAQKSKATEAERLRKLRNLFIDLLEKNLPKSIINGSTKHFSPHLLHISFGGQDNERLMMQLDEAGVMVAVGSACSASSNEPSHVLKAIGMSDEQARSSLRFSFGRNTSAKDIKRTVSLLQKFCN